MKKSIKILLASLVMIAFVIGFSAFRSANTAKKETVKTHVVKKDAAKKKVVSSFSRVYTGSGWIAGSGASCNHGSLRCSYTSDGSVYDGENDDDIAAADAYVEANFNGSEGNIGNGITLINKH